MIPRVTITLLTYNRSKLLEHAIKGCLAQSFQDFELLIIDNASSDNTAQVVGKFDDSRIRYIRNSSNLGSIKSSYVAYAQAKGYYLLIVHDDDIMKPDMVRRQVEILDAHPDVVMVSVNMDIIDENNTIVQKNFYELDTDIVYKKHGFVKDYCSGVNIIAAPTVMFRRSFMIENKLAAIEGVGPASDTYLWFQVNAYEKIIYIIHDSLYLYRIHDMQDSSVNIVPMHLQLYPHLKKYLMENNLCNYLPNLTAHFSNIIEGNLKLQKIKRSISLLGFVGVIISMRRKKLISLFDGSKIVLYAFIEKHFPVILFGWKKIVKKMMIKRV